MKCILGFILAAGLAAAAVVYVMLWMSVDLDGMVETDSEQDG